MQSDAAPQNEPKPDAFGAFMAAGWAAAVDDDVPVAEVASFANERRQSLLARFPGETLIVPTGTYKVRSNDTDYVFRPGTDFYWLTGCDESDAILVLSDDDATLYLPGRSDRSTSAFYQDRRYGELWVGPRRGVRETEMSLGLTCRPLNTFDASHYPGARVLRDFDDSVDAAIAPDVDRDKELAVALSELRLIKDSFELKQLRAAIDATVTGFEDCIQELDYAIGQRRGERWLEGTFWRRARLEGNDVGYISIVACGHHATTLHWVRNDGAVRPGDLALLDMGIESDSLYTADITRTIPVNGVFSPTQRQVYELVWSAQQAAFAEVKPGASFLDPHHAAMRVIAEALEQWGILPVSAEEALRPENGQHRRYTLHGVSHMLGLDVHDCANARNEQYYLGTLQEGMVLTVEPGLYFQIDDMTVPKELRGIGVRIEDDVLVTAGGCEILSSALPSQVDQVEHWMAQRLRRKPSTDGSS